MSNKYLIVGNWKMNPMTQAEAKKIAGKIKRVAQLLVKTNVVICPPLLFIDTVRSKRGVNNFEIGAQYVYTEESVGAFTGQVSASMLKDVGAKYVIVGHSEQRSAGDTNDIVSKRLNAVLNADLVPILCVGESVRDESGAYMEELKKQIEGSLALVPKSSARDIVIAYEPVWAIGAKEAMLPEQIYETSLFIKKAIADMFGPDNGLKMRVLYGGSVNFRNAFEIISVGKVDGLLVGRESVNTPGFVELLKAVDLIK